METKKIILIVIVILIIALAAVLAYSSITGDDAIDLNITDNATDNNTTDVIMIDDVDDDNTTVGDDSPRNETSDDNQTYRVYNPQDDAYVTVVGEGYDDEVDRWYTYDTDGVRYYNTRIN